MKYILLCCGLFLVSANARIDSGLGVMPPASKPNLVFIMADDLGYSDLGCYGNTFNETPNLDKLAQSGVRFTQSYAACPVCSPTRASLMTGKYPARLGLTDFIPGRQARTDIPHLEKLIPPDFLQALPKAETTLAELFKTEGYATALVGKWHLGNGDNYATSHGFDVQIGTAPGGSPPSYFFPYQGSSNYVSDNRLDDLNKTGKQGEYLTDRLTDEAIRFMETNREKPFFLYMAHYAPHIPIQSKPELIDKYTRKKENRTPRHSVENPQYAALLHSLDESVGRLTEALQRLGLEQNTVVVFMSDNGGLVTPEGKFTPATTCAPLRDGKGYLHEGGIRVPLLIRWPGRTKPGQTSEAMLCSIDFFPTFHHLLKGQLPTDPTVDGQSFLNVLTGKPKPRTLFWHYPHYPNQGALPGGAIRSGNWKLIQTFEPGLRADESLELYDLANDLGESRNLAQEQPRRAAALLAQLKTWQQQVGAKIPVVRQ